MAVGGDSVGRTVCFDGAGKRSERSGVYKLLIGP